jgi:hypothetical protein
VPDAKQNTAKSFFPQSGHLASPGGMRDLADKVRLLGASRSTAASTGGRTNLPNQQDGNSSFHRSKLCLIEALFTKREKV